MPFLSRDWRGPGEDWVKCQDGWETRKVAIASGQLVINSDSEIVDTDRRRRRCKTEPGLHKGEINSEKENQAPGPRLERHRSLPVLQPFCPITIKCTREIAGFNTLSDVLKRLDFRSAVHDIRRFQYVSSLLRLLLHPERLFHLPGSCQKLIFRILEEMAVTVFSEKRGEHVLKKLLQDLHVALDERKVWGSNHGSETLNRAHKNARRRLACITAVEQKRSSMVMEQASPEQNKAKEGDDKMEIVPYDSRLKETEKTLEELPEECVREILLQLSHPRDIDNAGSVMPTMSLIVKERRIWRELVQAHFTTLQIEFMLNKKPDLKEGKKWRDLYFHLKRHFGLRQEFTELVVLCKPCRVLFWQTIGHPCLQDTGCKSGQIPLTPSTFLTFFSI